MALAPAGRLMVSVMLPVPDAAQAAPDVGTQFQIAPVSVAGRVSDNVAPPALDGPAFVATIV